MPATVKGLRRRAFVSVDAIGANARMLLGTSTFGAAVIDARANAYGHGLIPVCEALARAGTSHFIVSGVDDRDLLTRRLGNVVVRVGELDHNDSAFTLLGPAVYGLSGSQPGLRPALRLVAEAVAVKGVPAGRGVSYGYTYRTASDTNLVLAGLGYADGIPRIASNRAPVLVHETRARVTGRIAMDQFVVDIGASSAAVGDDVVLFGDAERGEPTALEWAQATGLRPEVIVSGLGPRIERVYA